MLKEGIGETRRKGLKTLNKKGSCYTQFHLELGQSDFLLRHCVECGATFAPGDELDEKSHQSFNKDYMNGIPFKLTLRPIMFLFFFYNLSFSGLAERESLHVAFFGQEPYCYGVGK